MSEGSRVDVALGVPAVEPPFAHASEAEMARILDFYAVRWQYEPHVFPILWNLEGDVIESFAPDFYLPDLELYLEMTTLKQRLVRKKNRKLRRLRELYPDLRVKLFYARDFRALMLKYGKLALHDELSGTPGQAPSPRAMSTVFAAAAIAATEAAAEVTAAGSVDRPPAELQPAEARPLVTSIEPARAAAARNTRSRSARRRRAAAARRAAALTTAPRARRDGDAA